MVDTLTRPVRLRETARLHQLFSQALATDFDYFDAQYLETARSANMRPRLSLGVVHPRRLILGLFTSAKPAEMIGFSLIGIERARQRSEAFLYWMYIVPDHRGKRLGKKLLQDSETLLRKKAIKTLRLMTHNQQHFYQQDGFEFETPSPKLISGVDMYMMRKELT